MLALEVIQPEPSTCDCPPLRCRFRVSLVRFYLAAYRQAQILREDPADILRDFCRSSTYDDPWIRGGRYDANAARDIMLSLEIARTRGGLQLHQWNAERISAYLCPQRWSEDD